MAEALHSAGVKLGNLWDVIVNLIGALCGWMLILSGLIGRMSLLVSSQGFRLSRPCCGCLMDS